MRRLRSVNAIGRKTGWVAVAAFTMAIFLVVAGLFRPAALTFAEPVLCDGQTLAPTDTSDLEILRRSDRTKLFCLRGVGVQDVTARWMFLVLGSVTAGACPAGAGEIHATVAAGTGGPALH